MDNFGRFSDEEKSLSVKRQMSNLQSMETLHKTIQSELQSEIDGLLANESKVRLLFRLSLAAKAA